MWWRPEAAARVDARRNDPALPAGPFWLEPLAPGAPLPAARDGLSGAEAAARLARSGPNLLRPRRARSLLRQYLSRFRNPLVLILLAASAASAATGELANFVIVSAMVLVSVTLDFAQEYRANAAAQALSAAVAVRAVVLRDGRRRPSRRPTSSPATSRWCRRAT